MTRDLDWLKNLTSSEVVTLMMDKNDPLNKARMEFSFGSGRIEQAGAQRTPLSAVAMRRMEFEVVIKIAQALGVTI